MLNIVVPMAGRGSRFANAGYAEPKPLIPVHGMPMIRMVINNLRPKNYSYRFTFITQKEHIERYNIESLLYEWGGGGTRVIALNGMTEGAVCTVLQAKPIIDNDVPLIIANCDQYIDSSIDEYIDKMFSNNLDGNIMTMTAKDPKWSFVSLNDIGTVTRVVEKEVISNEATVGIYSFLRGKDFVRAAEDMIKMDLRVNGEFYVAPVYNQLIKENMVFGVHNIGGEGNGMYGLGIPLDLAKFLSLPLSHRATSAEGV